eukprot:CAMPEP_0202343622 /NCGR_PEP_ID=MMETSP1126-20121109/3658_1 /ASSEMBLY_ACC=CAM_ASM_000457 /TAXON_ID=3047 /ORGANISM="Dunaliella tertiolecta, Strain CCMP1320" /LENGTH=112 /DNA_ID=CAMNT_0048934705 /DNA_START=85 /DNA_END=423 /DNA_ORIENTATION=+
MTSIRFSARTRLSGLRLKKRPAHSTRAAAASTFGPENSSSRPFRQFMSADAGYSRNLQSSPKYRTTLTRVSKVTEAASFLVSKKANSSSRLATTPAATSGKTCATIAATLAR